MKRDFLIKSLMYDKQYGFHHIVDSTEEFKNELNSVIKEARVSIPTLKLFLSFCEEAIKKEGSYEIDIKHEMLGAAIFVTNCVGLDCKRIGETLTRKDMEDMHKINEFDLSK